MHLPTNFLAKYYTYMKQVFSDGEMLESEEIDQLVEETAMGLFVSLGYWCDRTYEDWSDFNLKSGETYAKL